jgi:hypothetical protein
MRDGSQGAGEGPARTRRGGQGEAVDRGAPCQLLLSVVIGNVPGRGVGCWESGRKNSKSWGAYMRQLSLFRLGGDKRRVQIGRVRDVYQW